MPPGEVELSQTWKIGNRIGDESGFGEVYEAVSGDTTGAAKFIPKAPGADRELLFVELDDATNVVPIIDSGESDGHWVLVMPRAEKSLKQHLEESGGNLDLAEAASILTDVASALTSLAGRVVHRDLKPANVLLLDGTWCLADFGISRYAEATTSDETQKFALTAPYAAPEQWRSERATEATDIYALGVIAFELVAGRRPFPGPTRADFRDQHLHDDPGQPEGAPAPLGSLIAECLYKAAETRPSAGVFLDRVNGMTLEEASQGIAALQEADRDQVSRRAEEVRDASRAQTAVEKRAEIASAAMTSLVRISDQLRDTIMKAASSARPTTGIYGDRPDWTLELGQATLTITPVGQISAGVVGSFDVVCQSSIGVSMDSGPSGYEGRGHSLWFCDAKTEGEYAWYETAFMDSPLLGGRPPLNPYPLSPEQAQAALAPAVGTIQVAWPFERLDPGSVGEFVDRWAGWFASASQGRLSHPTSIPEKQPAGSWRR